MIILDIDKEIHIDKLKKEINLSISNIDTFYFNKTDKISNLEIHFNESLEYNESQIDLIQQIINSHNPIIRHFLLNNENELTNPSIYSLETFNIQKKEFINDYGLLYKIDYYLFNKLTSQYDILCCSEIRNYKTNIIGMLDKRYFYLEYYLNDDTTGFTTDVREKYYEFTYSRKDISNRREYSIGKAEEQAMLSLKRSDALKLQSVLLSERNSYILGNTQPLKYLVLNSDLPFMTDTIKSKILSKLVF